MASAEADGVGVLVRFTLKRGKPSEVVDRLDLATSGDMPAVAGVGRLLRILRAGRIKPPDDPYQLGHTPERAAELVARCAGAEVQLQLRRRTRRALTVWTEDGVEEIPDLLDCSEDGHGLWVRRLGGRSQLHFPKQKLVRFETRAEASWEVVSVDAAR